MPRRLLTAAVALLVTVGLVPAPSGAGTRPDPASAESARKGAAYLASTQGANGSVPSGWTANAVAETVIALAAGGGQATAVDRAVEFLADRAFQDTQFPQEEADRGPYTAQVVAGLVAAGENPRDFAGHNFVRLLESHFDPITGGYGGQNLYADALAMLGVLAAEAELPPAAVNRLKLHQCPSGGWSYLEGCLGNHPDTDTTAIAMSVLAADLGPGVQEVRAARQWLLGSQKASGGWGFEPSNSMSSNSTGLALSAIVAIGEDPAGAPWTGGQQDPLGALRTLQLGSGGFKRQASASVADNYATVQAVPGMAGWWYPVVARDEEGEPVETPSTTSTTSPAQSRHTTTTAAAKNGERGGAEGRSAGPTGVDRTTTSSEPPRVDASSTTTGIEPRPPVVLGQSLSAAGRRPGERDPGRPVRATFDDDGSGGGGMAFAVATTVAVGLLAPIAGGTVWYRRRKPNLEIE